MSIMINQTRIPFAHLFPNFAEYKNFYFFSFLLYSNHEFIEMKTIAIDICDINIRISNKN